MAYEVKIYLFNRFYLLMNIGLAYFSNILEDFMLWTVFLFVLLFFNFTSLIFYLNIMNYISYLFSSKGTYFPVYLYKCVINADCCLLAILLFILALCYSIVVACRMLCSSYDNLQLNFLSI